MCNGFKNLNFITNEGDCTLTNRLSKLLEYTKSFDTLVGYFYISGFYKLYDTFLKNAKDIEKIRILIGKGVDKKTFELVKQSKNRYQLEFTPEEQIKDTSLKRVIKEMENSEDKNYVEEGIKKFIEWVNSKKLEIKVYPSQKLHAKLYIMTFKENDRDIGRVITGSSNFTKSGLTENLEFNVELKNEADYIFAKKKFEELWDEGIDLTQDYVNTIKKKTWLNDNITPYELYLKFLYEYFKDELNLADIDVFEDLPKGFKKLEYQEQAVLNAKRILDEHGGVFISDVVGLGKTYISALLAKQLDGRHLVIVPPALLGENNPGSWRNIFSDFKVAADFKSKGKLDDILKQGVEKYKNVFIDEAHNYRNEDNATYGKLARICRGKRVILVTATPFNNRPSDILAQIKLFQNAKRSTIPNRANLERFFNELNKRLKSKENDYEEYIKIVRDNSKKIRDEVLKYIMIRRTRSEIKKYFAKDLKREKIKFPEVNAPEPIFYKLNEKENDIFDETIELFTKDFNYARYNPMRYYKTDEIQELKNKNTGISALMKIFLVKRLDSSFFAFKNSINRIIKHYEIFLKNLNKGYVYVNKEKTNKLFEALEEDDYKKVDELILKGKAEKYSIEKFDESLKKDLEHDLEKLGYIRDLWEKIDRDPKLLELKKTLGLDKNKNKKIIIFTESKETAEYLYDELNKEKEFVNKVLVFSGNSNKKTKKKTTENFDANDYNQKDDYRILVTTDVLAEGVNLHRSNIVINYDIPWNPAKIMQRVGRVNRIGTKFNEIYIYNFFPAEQYNNQLKLEETAESKIEAFITLLGSDAKLLTESEEIQSHKIFKQLTSKESILDEDENEVSELKFLQEIKKVRDKEPKMFDKIKNLPKKARTAKMVKRQKDTDALLTYFKKGKLSKFFITNDKETKELDFIEAAKILKSSNKDIRQKIPSDFYKKLEENRKMFDKAVEEENNIGGLDKKNDKEKGKKGNRGKSSNASIVEECIKKTLIKDTSKLTDEQIKYMDDVLNRIKNRIIPKNSLSEIKKKIGNASNGKHLDSLILYNILKENIPSELLENHISDKPSNLSEKASKEIVLSEYLVGGN